MNLGEKATLRGPKETLPNVTRIWFRGSPVRVGSKPPYRTFRGVVVEGIEDLADIADGVARSGAASDTNGLPTGWRRRRPAPVGHRVDAWGTTRWGKDRSLSR